MKYRNLEDRCPLCGSGRLVFSGAELHDSAVAYPMLCRDCGATWMSWYSLVYDGNTDVMDKKGMEVD